MVKSQTELNAYSWLRVKQNLCGTGLHDYTTYITKMLFVWQVYPLNGMFKSAKDSPTPTDFAQKSFN